MRSKFGYFEDDYVPRERDGKLISKIIAIAAPHWKWVTFGLILSFGVTAASLALPYLLRLGIDQYIVNEELANIERVSGITQLSFLFLIIMLAGFGAQFCQIIVLEWAGQNMMHSLRRKLFIHTLHLPISFFNVTPVGRIVTRVTNDIQNMHEMFTSVVVTGVNDFIRLGGILILLFWMNWRLACVVSLVYPFLVLSTVLFGRLARDVSRQIRTSLAGLNTFIQENVSGVSVLQLFGVQQDSMNKYHILGEDYCQLVLRQIRIFGTFMPLIEFLQSIALSLIIWYGGGEIIREHMTLGDLTAFISYIRLFFQPVRELSQKYSIVQSAMASAERIFHLMDQEKTDSTGIIPLHIDGKIEFQGVSFSYEKNHPVLRNLTFTVRPGETLAIVGATGAGKSTIINLIERFHAPDEGAILLDGVNLQQLSSEWLRKMIGFVPQDLFIIAGTIRENIVLDLEVSDEDLDGILDLSQMSSVVKNLPDGLQTRIGEGFDLSRGQQQLMSLARVLARNPKILILDEATANVDSETEMLIDQALENVMSQRTCILIAHRLSTIRRADWILVMERGKIVESGSHDGLMAEKGHYFRLQRLLNITE